MHGKEWGASPLLAAPRVLLQGAAPTFLTSHPHHFHGFLFRQIILLFRQIIVLVGLIHAR